MRARVWRRVRQLILALVAAGLLISLCLVAGPAINDRSIAAHRGRALATVTGTGLLRTTVEFLDEDGLYRAPARGLLYPTGVAEGQRVWVEYDVTAPELVKVSGRGWTLALLPALSVATATCLLGALAWTGATWAEERGARRAAARDAGRGEAAADARGDRR